MNAEISLLQSWTCLRAIGLRQRSHQIQLFALLVRVDGRSLVVIDQLVQRVELPLPNAVHVLLHVHAEVLVAPWGLQRNRIVSHLQERMNSFIHSQRIRAELCYGTSIANSTYVSLTVSDEEVAIVPVAVEHRVALATGDGSIIPRLARQIWPLDWLAGGLCRRLVTLIAPLHGVVSSATTCAAITSSSISVSCTGTRITIGRGQVVVQLLEIIAWN